MPVSQNLLFIATASKDLGFDHPPGAALMRILAEELARSGWTTGEVDNWRDCGWSISDAAHGELTGSAHVQ